MSVTHIFCFTFPHSRRISSCLPFTDWLSESSLSLGPQLPSLTVRGSPGVRPTHLDTWGRWYDLVYHTPSLGPVSRVLSLLIQNVWMFYIREEDTLSIPVERMYWTVKLLFIRFNIVSWDTLFIKQETPFWGFQKDRPSVNANTCEGRPRGCVQDPKVWLTTDIVWPLLGSRSGCRWCTYGTQESVLRSRHIMDGE